MSRIWPSAARRAATSVALALIAGSTAYAAAPVQAGAVTRGHKTHGYPLTIAVTGPFSGTTAIFGPTFDTGAYAGEVAVNRAGGILGHPVTIENVDTKGDAADAVSVIDKVLASSGHLICFIGPGTTSPSLVPLIAGTDLPMFSDSTAPRYDHNTNPYFFRILPSDSLAGTSLAYYAVKHGYKHAVAVWLTSTSSQTNVPSFQAVYKDLGGKLAGNFSIAPTLTNYRTEALAILNAKPDAIVMDSNSKTASTLLTDLKQLGKIPEVITDSTGETPTFISAVEQVLGKTVAVHKFVGVSQAAPNTKSLGYKTYYKSLVASHKKTLLQFAPLSYAYFPYTAIVLDALALTGNKTLNPKASAIPSTIKSMTVPGKGKVTVHTYAQGLAALKRGVSVKKLYYFGAYGRIDLNKYNNASATFQAARYGASPTSPLVSIGKPISAKTLGRLLAKTGL